MKKNKLVSTLLAGAMIISTVFQSVLPAKAVTPKESTEDFTDYVNMYIGTKYDPDIHWWGTSEYGGTMLMVTAPFGMTNFVPQTRLNYESKMPNASGDTHVAGFMATHQPAVWMEDYGYVSMMPEVGEIKTKFDDRKLEYDKDSEVAIPSYYAVDLKTADGDIISTETTATERCAIYNFKFPENATSSMFVEASRSGINGNIKIDSENQLIMGYNTAVGSSKWVENNAKDFKGYFVIEFNKPFSATGTSKDYQVTAGETEITSNAAGGYVTFDNPNNEVIQAKIGMSFISFEQAKENLNKEIPDWDFDKVEKNLRDTWNDKLGTIEIEGASEDERTIFYTALYHSLLYPRMISEYGKYYSPYDGKIHEGESYTDFSMWDTFRAQNPLLTLVAPERIDGMIQSLLQNYQEGGWLPKWPNMGYSNVMIGTHADSLIAEAIVKGFDGF